MAAALAGGCSSPASPPPPGAPATGGSVGSGGSSPGGTGGSAGGREPDAATAAPGDGGSGASDASAGGEGRDAALALDAAAGGTIIADPATGVFPIPPGLTRIFDGTSLEGWDGDTKWSVNVEDKAIQGHTGGFNLLKTKMNYGDFRLILTERMVLKGPSTNHLGECFWGPAYVAGNFKFGSCIVFIAPHGSLWDYGGGGNVFQGMGAGEKTDWQQVEILAIASTGQILAAVNGVQTTNYTRKSKGTMSPIGLQSHADHAGDTPGLIEYKDIYVESPPTSMTLLTVKH
jgi:hypothetical protein